MTQQEINIKLNRKKSEFLLTRFSGKVPSWMKDRFLSALMDVPPSSTKYKAERIREMISRDSEEWNNYEVGLMVDILSIVSPKVVWPDMETYLTEKLVLEEIGLIYNTDMNALEQALKREGAALANMKGVNGSKLAKA